MKILFLNLFFSLDHHCTLKERRAVAYAIRDRLKHRYNCSLKLSFDDDPRSFTIYMVALGDLQDYLEQLVDKVLSQAETQGGASFTYRYEIEEW